MITNSCGSCGKCSNCLEGFPQDCAYCRCCLRLFSFCICKEKNNNSQERKRDDLIKDIGIANATAHGMPKQFIDSYQPTSIDEAIADAILTKWTIIPKVREEER